MKLTLFLLLLIAHSFLNAQAFLESPIEGAQGNEWIIANYVDWDFVGFKDHHCGSKSYDGHQGTDFVIRSFKAMDDSIAVYAAASGTVVYVIDTLFDRETLGDTAKHLGNYIAISHPNNYQTYYAHLVKNSSQVAVGDIVQSGDIIGYVGSSGNSTDPHLHFELWYDSTFVVDPFAGSCGNSASLFISPAAYDTSLTIWESGLHLKNNLTINDLRERIITLTEPYVIAPSSDSALNFWTHLYGLRAGKTLEIQWYTPTNLLWYNDAFVLGSDYWYYYYWNNIIHQSLAEGIWTVKLLYDGAEIVSETFEVNGQLSVYEGKIESTFCDKFKNYSFEKLMTSNHFEVKVFNISGQSVLTKNVSQLPAGIYFLKISNENNSCVLKRLVR